MTWTPDARLGRDLLECIGQVPAPSPEDRFERLAWASLLRTVGPALLTRAAAPAHVTASALPLTPDGRRTCLVLHGRMGLWVQPGGHLEEGDASVADAAAREVLEETGLRGAVRAVPLALSRHRAPCRPQEVDWHLDVQHLLVTAETEPVVSAESRDVAWWDVTALPRDTAPGVAALVALGVAALGGAAPPLRDAAPAGAVIPRPGGDGAPLSAT